MRSTARPVDEALARLALQVAADDRRGRAQRRADEDPRLPGAVVAPGARRSRRSRPGRPRHETRAPSSIDSTSGRSGPNRRTATSRKRSASPVVSCRWVAGTGDLVGSLVAGQPGVRGGAAGRARSLEAVDDQQLGQRGRRRRRRVDDRDAIAGDRGDQRPQQRVVGTAQQQRVDRRAGRSREDRLAVGVALAQQRRQGGRDRRLGLRPDQDPGLHHRNERRRRVLVHLDGRVLVLDRREVGVRPDGGRRGDDADPPVPRRQGRRRGTGPDDAQDRQRVAPSEGADPDGGRGVAGHDDRLDVALRERVERLGREGQDLVVGARAVRRAGVVAEVDRRFVRRPPGISRRTVSPPTPESKTPMGRGSDTSGPSGVRPRPGRARRRGVRPRPGRCPG